MQIDLLWDPNVSKQKVGALHNSLNLMKIHESYIWQSLRVHDETYTQVSKLFTIKCVDSSDKGRRFNLTPMTVE